MADLTTKEGCVDAGVEMFAALETRLQKAQEKALGLVPIFEAANGLAMMGGLQTGRMKAKAKAIAGLAAQAEMLAWELHKESQFIAEENGVDVVIIAGGGPR